MKIEFVKHVQNDAGVEKEIRKTLGPFKNIFFDGWKMEGDNNTIAVFEGDKYTIDIQLVGESDFSWQEFIIK